MFSDEDSQLQEYEALFQQCRITPALNLLLLKLKISEQEGKWLLSARLCTQIADYFKRVGRYQAASYWLSWGLQIHETQKILTNTYWKMLFEWLAIKLLLDDIQKVEAKLAYHAEREYSDSTSWFLSHAQLYVDFYRGQIEKVLEEGWKLWVNSRERQNLPDLANIYVRALMAVGHQREARDIVEQLSYLVEGLDFTCQSKALFLKGLIQLQETPALAKDIFLNTYNDLPLPWNLQAELMLLKAYERLEDSLQARRNLERLSPFLHEIGHDGIAFLLGKQNVLASPQLSHKFRTDLELRVLGTPKLRYQNETLTLRPRFAELLVVLAAHPKGMTKAQLSLAVYGESYDSSCCKTEISRLKQLVPLKSQPYQLDLPIWADYLELLSLIEAGQIDNAINLYQGPLLTFSDAPEVCRWRDIVSQALCNAALEAPSPEPLWKLANKMRDDLVLWEGVLTRLPQGDPRRALALAHAHSLRRSWGLI